MPHHVSARALQRGRQHHFRIYSRSKRRHRQAIVADDCHYKKCESTTSSRIASDCYMSPSISYFTGTRKSLPMVRSSSSAVPRRKAYCLSWYENTMHDPHLFYTASRPMLSHMFEISVMGQHLSTEQMRMALYFMCISEFKCSIHLLFTWSPTASHWHIVG